MALRELVFHNFWLKLFSLVLAILVWFAIHVLVTEGNTMVAKTFVRSVSSETFQSVPVRVLKMPGDKRSYEISPTEVSVTVTGDSAALRDLEKDKLVAYIDLSSTKVNPVAWADKVRTETVHLHVPVNITVVRVIPLSTAVAEIKEEKK
jgi:YbbR domain-containing protein